MFKLSLVCHLLVGIDRHVSVVVTATSLWNTFTTQACFMNSNHFNYLLE